ncbi:MAG: DUF2851 family protein [Bacteroidales bacterium]|nr:DUF2851 family protein [Bacteroidales bacterium]
MTEDFLQYLWQHQLLRGPLVTTDGRLVTVERAGELNRDAGPDFTNAIVFIDNIRWAGNIEIHVKASDWKQHHHDSDKAYNTVVLHVVYDHDADISLPNGQPLPTVEIRQFVPESFWQNYQMLVNSMSTNDIACGGRLTDIADFAFNSHLERLAVERLARKTEGVKRLLDESAGSWEQCCYWLMAHYFGGKVNGFAFELLSKATDLRLLARWKDSPQRLEALLMGQAGLLDGLFDDEYPRALQADYEAIRAGAGLTPMAGYLWRSFRLRPSSFPTIRISQFAALLSQSSHLFSTLLECTSVKEIELFFDVEAAPYWTTHYQFDQPAKASPKRLGQSQTELIIINAWLPLLFHYGTTTGQQKYHELALDLLAQLPAENNNIIRRWSAMGRTPTSALQSQAMLELFNEYCTAHRCLACQIGYRIIKAK